MKEQYSYPMRINPLYILIVLAIGYLIYMGFFQSDAVTNEEIKNFSCEELKDAYINFDVCRNLWGRDVCRNKILIEYIDKC